MNIEFVEHLSECELNEFVMHSPYKSIYQMSCWAQVKKTWEHAYVGLRIDDKLQAAGMILFRNLGAGLKMAYMTRGPILDYSDDKVLKIFFSEVKKYCRKRKAIVLKFDPNIKIAACELNEKQKAQEARNDELVNRLENCGAQFLGYHLELSKAIQPRFQMNFPLEENFENRFSSKQKKKIKEAVQKGVVVIEGGLECLNDFIQVIHCTERRKGIALRNEEYFADMLKAYDGHSTFLVAKIDYQKALQNCQNELDLIDKQMCELPFAANKKRNELERKIEKINKEIAMLEKDQKELGSLASALLLVDDGTTAELLYSGLDERYRRYLPAYILRYEGMKWAYRKGCKYFNFGGVQGTFDDGLFEFKSSFNPCIDVYLGEFDLPCIDFIYPLWAHGLPLAKKAIRSLRYIKID